MKPFQQARLLVNKYGTFLFVLVFAGLCFFYNLDETMFFRPQSFHAWRQADCLSITQNYYQYDNNFWTPEIHNQLSDNDLSGKTAGEFPLLYYFVAMIWKLFGKSEFVYRMVSLILAFTSLLLIFRFSREVIGSTVYSFFTGLLLFTSAVYVFYAANFLPNVPALSLVFTGWFFVWKFYKSDADTYFWLAMFFFGLGFLIKVSAGISFFAVGGWFVIELFLAKENRVLFKRANTQFIPFLLVILAVAGWYSYASWYNHFHDGKYTFNDVWPVWDLSFGEILTVLKGAYTFIGPHYFESSIFFGTAVLWIYLILSFRKRSLILNYLLIVIPFGSFIYFLMWFQAFDVHDYYWIDFYPAIILVWILFFYTVREMPVFKHWLIKMAFLALLIFNIIYCHKIMKARYEGWPVEPFVNHMQAVGEMEPVLVDMGIGPDDKVISMPDYSINYSLYLMNRKGFCNYNSEFEKPGVMTDRIAKGAIYLIINDTLVTNEPWLKPYLDYPLKTYRNVKVFDLRPYLK